MTHISVVETLGYNFLRLIHFMEKFSLLRHSDIKEEHKVDSKACKRKKSVAVFSLPFSLAQCAKKRVSDSPGLVDFTIGLVNFFFTCPTGE